MPVRYLPGQRNSPESRRRRHSTIHMTGRLFDGLRALADAEGMPLHTLVVAVRHAVRADRRERGGSIMVRP